MYKAEIAKLKRYFEYKDVNDYAKHILNALTSYFGTAGRETVDAAIADYHSGFTNANGLGVSEFTLTQNEDDSWTLRKVTEFNIQPQYVALIPIVAASVDDSPEIVRESE
jgi:hypothetical protein